MFMKDIGFKFSPNIFFWFCYQGNAMGIELKFFLLFNFLGEFM